MPPAIHLVVNLPYNRPTNAPSDPIPVEWNQEKENILWEVIAKSRAIEGAGTDWQGLSNHLQVPLPYLLYRAQIRYEQDLKGIHDLRGVLESQPTKRPQAHTIPDPRKLVRSPQGPHSPAIEPQGSLSKSRATLRNHQSNRPVMRRTSSQTLIGKGIDRRLSDRRHTSPTLSDNVSSEEESEMKDREAKKEEEQDALTRRLQELERVMTNERLGLVHKYRLPSRSASLSSDRRPSSAPSSVAPENPPESLSASPQGSIPSIPSPLSGSQVITRHQPLGLHSPKSSLPASPPLYAPGHANMLLRYGGRTKASDRGSTQASTASSFSDISEADVSASVLESAQFSNSPGGSRLSAFTRARFGTHR